MRNLYKILLVTFIASQLTKCVFSQSNNLSNEKITFHDFKEFVYYVRDSVARENLSEEISDFSTEIFWNSPREFQLNFRVKIKYDPELVDILLSDNFIIEKGKSVYIINFTKLEYKNNRNDTSSIVIMPELNFLIKEFGEKFDSNLTFKNNWNNDFDEKEMSFLTAQQLSAYYDWYERQNKSNLRDCCKGYKEYSQH